MPVPIRKTQKSTSHSLDALTEQQRRFVLELIGTENWNASEAARKAGYTGACAGPKLLAHPKIQAFLGVIVREREEATKCRGNQVLEFMHTALMLNPFEFFVQLPNGRWGCADPTTLPPLVQRCVVSTKFKTIEWPDGRVEQLFECKLLDKLPILQLAMKHHRLIDNDPTVNNNLNVIGPELIARLMEGKRTDNVITVDAVPVEDPEPQSEDV